MAITVSFNADEYGDLTRAAALKTMLGEIVGPASYTTNGFTADAIADFEVELSKIKHSQVTSDAGYTATFNADHNKIVVYASSGTEVTAAVDLSGVNFSILLLVSDE